MVRMSGLLRGVPNRDSVLSPDYDDEDLRFATPVKSASAGGLPCAASVDLETPEKSASAHCLLGVAAQAPVHWLQSIPRGLKSPGKKLDAIGKCMHMRDVKAIKLERAKIDALQNSVRGERQAWNGRVARHGDRLHVNTCGRSEDNEESICVRRNQLTPEGVLRYA